MRASRSFRRVDVSFLRRDAAGGLRRLRRAESDGATSDPRRIPLDERDGVDGVWKDVGSRRWRRDLRASPGRRSAGCQRNDAEPAASSRSAARARRGVRTCTGGRPRPGASEQGVVYARCVPSLRPCPDCKRHVRAIETACPFCDAALPQAAMAPVPTGRVATRAAILFASATAIAACGGREDTSSSSSSSTSSSGSSGGSSSGSSSTSSSGGSSGTSSSGGSSGTSSSGGSSSGAVPPYGVPPVDGGDDFDGGGAPLYGPPPLPDE
jgi:hypothetical protein